MNINMRPTQPTPAPVAAEHGTIEGLDASIHTLNGRSWVTLRAWGEHCDEVSTRHADRDEAIAKAVRMARACGMIGE